MIEREPGQAGDDRRSRVLAAAVEEFARHGYHAASTNRVALRARVAKGLVFHYFGNKEGLYRAVLDDAWRRIFHARNRRLPADPFERFHRGVTIRLSRLAASPAHARVVAEVAGRGPCTSGSAHHARLKETYDALRASMKAGADTASFRPEVPPDQGLELLALVAEGLERRYLRILSHPPGVTADPLRNLREEAGAYVDLLRRGIYRPEARRAGHVRRHRTSSGVRPRTAPTVQPRRGDHRRNRILRAALDLFAARGYDGTSAQAVAARAGVAKGLVFHHFGSKAGLYLAAVQEARERMVADFFAEGDPPPADLFERLGRWSMRKIQLFHRHPLAYRLILEAVARPPEAVREELGEYVQKATESAWAFTLEGIDTTPFRPEVPPGRALALVVLVLNTLSDRYLERLAATGAFGIESLEDAMREVHTYLTLLRDGLCPA